MKIAIAGKGGVGKTTVTALLARHYAHLGRPVLAIDADPSPCLGAALAFPEDTLSGLSPIAAMRDLIAERTGSSDGLSPGAFFRLNPDVRDLPDRFSADHEGVRLLLLGAVEEGGSGCICPASALLKELVRHVVTRRSEIVLLDLYAGVEHLGRGTAKSVDVMLVVAEPTRRSLGTARQIRALAADIGLRNLLLLGNKIAGDADRRFFEDNAGDFPLAGCLEAAPEAATADRTGAALYPLAPRLAAQTAAIAARLDAGAAA